MSQAIPLSHPARVTTTPPILRASGIRKTFKMGEAEVTVLKNVELTLRPGEFVAIEGRSGSGKSTLLHILGALDAPDEGTLEFDGHDYTPRMVTGSFSRRLWEAVIGRESLLVLGLTLLMVLGAEWAIFRFVPRDAARAIAWYFRYLPAPIAGSIFALIYITVRSYLVEWPSCVLRNKEFGFVFQFYHLLPELNVLENALLTPMTELSWLAYQTHRAELVSRAVQLLNELGLGHRLTHRVNKLSGGERQRVAIARALMNSPRILFADEPTGNLDDETGRQIMGVLEKLHRERGQTVVMVTHDRTLARQADRILVLREGRLEKAEA